MEDPSRLSAPAEPSRLAIAYLNTWRVGSFPPPDQLTLLLLITSKGSKVLIGYCSIRNRKKSMTVSDNTIKAEGLVDFFKNLGKRGLNVSKKRAKNVLGNPGRALDSTAKIATAAASRNSKQALSTLPELIAFYNTGKGLYLGKFV